MTQFSPFAGSTAFLGGLGQGVDMRQQAERLRLAQIAQQIQQQQAAADDAFRMQQFQALEAQRATANQQWQAEQQRLQQQNAAQQAYQQAQLGMQGQRFGLDQQEFAHRQQQDQQQRQDVEAQRGNVAAYRANLGIQQPGMQGPPMPVDFGALPASVQSYDIQSAMRKQADDAERARRWSGYENFSNKGLWKQATGSFVEKAVEDGYPVPDDVKEQNGIFDFAGVQQAYNKGDFAGVAGPMAQAGMPLNASGAAAMLERMAPDAAQASKTIPKIVPVPVAGNPKNVVKVPLQGSNGGTLVWDETDPVVDGFMQAAALAEKPQLDRSWWNPRPDEAQADYQNRVRQTAVRMAAGLGWSVQSPGTAPAGASRAPSGQAPAAAPLADVQAQIRAWAQAGLTRDQIKQKLREMGVGN